MAKNHSESTKERILDSAELLFAKDGYNGVSIRAITDAAECNQASVHYHFGNKEKLYLEVFRSRWLPREQSVLRFFEETLGRMKNPTPPKVIEAFARAYIDGPLSDSERQRQRLLVVRELSNPGEAFELVAEKVTSPAAKLFLKYLKPFTKSGVTEKSLTTYVLSVFGMVYYFTYSRSIISHIMGAGYDRAFKDRLIKHIVKFSLSGIPLADS